MLIKIKGLKKSFKKHEVIRGLDMEIPTSGIVLLKGKNGSGKSTLIKLIAKFIKKDFGEIIYYDGDFFEKSGFVLDVPTLIADLNFKDNMEMIGGILKMDKSAIELKISEFEAKFNLTSKQLIKNYSLGMKKKAEIARSLLTDPKYIFWDEPFSSLDKESIAKLQKYITENNENKLFFVATHTTYLENFANQVLYI